MTSTLVKAKVIEEFRRRSERDGTSSSTVLKVTHKSNKKFCVFCKRSNHVRDECHKYTKWLQKKKDVNGSNQNNGNNKTDGNKANVVQTAESEKNVIFAVGHANGWIADSGCSTHISCSKSDFIDMDDSYREEVSVAKKGALCTAMGKGTIVLHTLNCNGESSKIIMKDALYVPEVEFSLLSVRRLDKIGYEVLFKNQMVTIEKNGVQYAVGDLKGMQYYIRLENAAHSVTANECNLVKNKEKLCIHQWHRVLGHRDMNVVKNLSSSGLVEDMHIAKCPPECKYICDDDCSPCALGKLSRTKAPKQSHTRSNAVLDLIHSDVCGPFKTATPSGKRWLLTFIDDFSRYTTIYLLNNKSEAFEKFKEFKELVQTKFQKKIKRIRTDRGGEYMGNKFLDYLAKQGIEQDRTAPHSSFQNGVAERKNRYLVEATNCMLLDADVSPSFWGEAMHNAAFIQNILPTKSAPNIPYESWHGRKPIYSYLRRFGAKCYVHVPAVKRTKLDPKADAGIFMGFDTHSKAYRIYVPSRHNIVVSCDVRFMGDAQLNVSHLSADKIEIEKSNNSNNEIEFEFAPIQRQANNDAVQEENIDDVTLRDIENENIQIGDDNDDSFVSNANDTILNNDSFATAESNDSDEENTNDTPRRSSRSTKGVPPTRLIDEMHLFMVSTCIDAPVTFEEAMNGEYSDEWMDATIEEFCQLQENNTWELVDLPKGRKAIGCKWVFKVKSDASGKLKKFKARLVAQGFSQKYGTDYDQVFAPVSRQSTFRILLSIAAHKNIDVYHFDAKTAFLNGDLVETIYMRQPTGFQITGAENKVCHLKRSIYGLKQSARVWNQALCNVLINAGFEQSKWDQCLFILKKGGGIAYILRYVDDIR